MNPVRVRRRASVLDRNQRRKHRPDYWLVILSIILLLIGLIVIYAISPALVAQRDVSENYYFSKQAIAIGLGVVAFIAMSQIPLSTWRRLQQPMIIAAAIAAVAVQFAGEEINGAYRWITIGGLSFQAAELIKFTLLFWLAGFLADRKRTGRLDDVQRVIKPLLIVLGVIAVVVGFLESDFGSTAVMVSMMAAMAFVAGMPMKRILMIGSIIAVGAFLLIVSTPYRRDRLATYLNPERDCQAAGYQACQALIAVGSGGMFGKGLAHSVQAYGYVPEAANDSIFAIYAEKFGFLGIAVLLGLFTAFFARLVRIAERAADDYSQLIVVGILAWLTTQAIINIGAMLGLLPLKGITLPFISYGGTSILFVTGAVGLVFQISRYTSFGVQNNELSERGRNDYPADRRGVRGAYHPAPGGR